MDISRQDALGNSYTCDEPKDSHALRDDLDKNDHGHFAMVDSEEAAQERAANSANAYVANHEGSHHKTNEERALVRKADLVIVPLCALLYLVAYLVRLRPWAMTRLTCLVSRILIAWFQDRNSIGNSRILGLEDDLGMSPKQFSDCVSLFCTYAWTSNAFDNL